MQAAVLTQNTILDVHSMMNDIARAKDALAHECKLREVTLDDKYTARSGAVYLSGIQALVRLLFVQKWRDEAEGLNTAGFVSGYRGSPIGGLDETLWKASKHLEANKIKFQPGVNEDLALTSVWGSQHIDQVGPSLYDGVFSLWYAKGPGVDRSIDVLKHANHAGSSSKGGVLLVAGDDHGGYSSTLPHQSEHVFAASMVPVLYPANVHEFIELGLHGWAMSRYSGCFVGFKAIADTVESSGSVGADPFATKIVLPTDVEMPPGGLHSRLWTETLGIVARAQEALMHDHKIYAALAYCRANRLNRTTIRSDRDRLGIVASGKAYSDVLEALQELGLTEERLNQIGVRLFKVAMPWPLEPDSVREFAVGLEEILVVEEKRQLVEYQLKEQLYNWRDDVRPRVIGKFDDQGEWVHPRGEWLLTPKADFTVAQVAAVIASRIRRFHSSDAIDRRLELIRSKEALLGQANKTPPRPAYYCSGCPHNTSTKVPEGSVALAGIGCHIMATTIYPEGNKTTTHMGGEGATWIGQHHFSQVKHVFANLGDGTYFHSGLLAIRAAVAAKTNITYKILYNDAVAMTGGQPHDGVVTVPMIAQQVHAEGVRRIAVVTEDVTRYANRFGLAPSVTVHDRSELERVQKELREVQGTSVIIYDQTCAAEKRRRRKKGSYPTPAKHLHIHEAVCEGCGDCGQQSNCVSLLPLETEFGRKRRIDDSNCNKDFSCQKGFCPSFVTIEGGKLRKPGKARLDLAAMLQSLPEPTLPPCDAAYNIMVTGIGGTGVITIGALLGMAAHLESKAASILDMTGMSQKNGAVTSHVRLARSAEAIMAQRIPTGEADLILGCDMLTAGSKEVVSKMHHGRTHALVNTHQQPTGQFTKNPDWAFPEQTVRQLITQAVGEKVDFVDATRLALAILGDSIGSNLFMVGFAFQRGLVPLTSASIERAIELNGVAIDKNLEAFRWGRAAAVHLQSIQEQVNQQSVIKVLPRRTLQQTIDLRVTELTDYQNEAYARHYLDLVDRVRQRDVALGVSADQALTRAVARNLFKLMAYKDEYEVARLYTAADFWDKIDAKFEGDFKVKLNLAPPLFAKRDADGNPIKQEYGSWMFPAMRVLTALRFLRGTRLDPFGWTAERRMERGLVDRYREIVERGLDALTSDNYHHWVKIANVPESIRGFGHVKHASVVTAQARWNDLLSNVPGAAHPAPVEETSVTHPG
jgi:indolepyruvate ferredoxin oxidoreductase